MGRSPVLGVTSGEVSGEREQSGRETYPQAVGQPVKTSARVRLGMAVSEASELFKFAR